MKTIQVAEAMNSLGEYARELKNEPLILTEGGHAIAALFAIDDDDLESLALSLSPKFQALSSAPSGVSERHQRLG